MTSYDQKWNWLIIQYTAIILSWNLSSKSLRRITNLTRSIINGLRIRQLNLVNFTRLAQHLMSVLGVFFLTGNTHFTCHLLKMIQYWTIVRRIISLCRWKYVSFMLSLDGSSHMLMKTVYIVKIQTVYSVKNIHKHIGKRSCIFRQSKKLPQVGKTSSPHQLNLRKMVCHHLNPLFLVYWILLIVSTMVLSPWY